MTLARLRQPTRSTWRFLQFHFRWAEPKLASLWEIIDRELGDFPWCSRVFPSPFRKCVGLTLLRGLEFCLETRKDLSFSDLAATVLLFFRCAEVRSFFSPLSVTWAGSVGVLLRFLIPNRIDGETNYGIPAATEFSWWLPPPTVLPSIR